MVLLCSVPMNLSAVFPKATASRQSQGISEQQVGKKYNVSLDVLFIMFDQGVCISSFFFLMLIFFFWSFIKMQCPLVDSIWAFFPSLPDNISG